MLSIPLATIGRCTLTNRLTLRNGLAALAQAAGKEFISLFRHGSLEVEIYKPNKFDPQLPHSRDEVYVVISGAGFFVKDCVRQPFEAGEVLFAAAGVNHRFEDFTEDFATWVFFYGPDGGEESTKS
jgi:mannose-6-phosphate isomerase-like protein (cupin superfamily)